MHSNYYTTQRETMFNFEMWNYNDFLVLKDLGRHSRCASLATWVATMLIITWYLQHVSTFSFIFLYYQGCRIYTEGTDEDGQRYQPAVYWDSGVCSLRGIETGWWLVSWKVMLCPIYEEKQKKMGGNAKIDWLGGWNAISRKPNFALWAAANKDW